MKHFREQLRQSLAANFMGRGPRGPWGHRGRGSDEREDFHPGRFFGHGDLRFVILSMIASRPYHGYELIKAIEEKTGGHYAPSPGVIYPTLTFLQEGGFATLSSQEGKNLYTITEEGRKLLQENREAVDEILSRITRRGEMMSRLRDWVGSEEFMDRKHGGGMVGGEIRKAFHSLKSVLFSRMPIPKEEEKAIAEILDKASAEIKNLKRTD